MTNRILIIFAHPRYEKSYVNRMLVSHIPSLPEITFHDLYQVYPDLNIDPEHEKELLTNHNIIVWQHPFYWYSAPPLLKQWIDLVLEFGWAYGPEGTQLSGKHIFNAITTGGQRTAYCREGYNNFTIRELLAPFEQTARLCKMIYLPPFVVHGTHRITPEGARAEAARYSELLTRLLSAVPEFKDPGFQYLNDLIDSLNKPNLS